MEVHLLNYSIRLDYQFSVITLLGNDMLYAEAKENGPGAGRLPVSYSVLIHTTHRALPFEIDLRDQVTNQPRWSNDRDGARRCLDDLTPYIRMQPFTTPSLPVVKRSLEYDLGAMQLVGDQDAPGPDHVYGTDNAGNRVWKPDPAISGIADLANAGSNPDVQLIESSLPTAPGGTVVLKRIKRDGLGTRAQANTNTAQINIHFSAQDRIHYSDALGDPVETPITSFGRSLIDDADATAARTTLGLGTAALVNTGTGVDAALAQNADSASGFVTQTGGDGRYIRQSIVNAKGDLITATADDTPAILTAGTNGQQLFADSAAAGGLAYAWDEQVIAFLNSSSAYSNMPAGLTWFIGAANGQVWTKPIPLTNKRQVKIAAFLTTAGFSTGKLIFRYRTSYSATAADYSVLGAGSTEVAVTLGTANTWVESAWIDIDSSARTDVIVGLFTIDGNGSADPVFQQAALLVR